MRTLKVRRSDTSKISDVANAVWLNSDKAIMPPIDVLLLEGPLDILPTLYSLDLFVSTGTSKKLFKAWVR
jgi:hypothetical protein